MAGGTSAALDNGKEGKQTDRCLKITADKCSDNCDISLTCKIRLKLF